MRITSARKPLLLFLLGLFFQQMAFAELSYEDMLKYRGQAIIDQTADKYLGPNMEIGDPQKYYWPVVMARFEKYGANDGEANALIRKLAEQPPFHFTLVGMARIISRYPEAPAIKELSQNIIAGVLNRSDNYNAFTCEGTENHIAMSRTSGYIYAEIAATKYPKQFPEAASRLSQMKEWLMTWSKTLYAKGNGEWNSGIYEAYHVIGYLNLYDYAQDPDVKAAAKAVLDYYATEMALHYSWGILGGPEMRGNGIGGSFYSSGAYLSFYWFGGKCGIKPMTMKGEYIQTMHAVTSTYRVPDAILALAQKDYLTEPVYYTNSRPDYLLTKAGAIRQQLYATKDYTLGSAISPYVGYFGTTAQLVNWKLVAKNENDWCFPFELSGNGTYLASGSGKGRDPYTQWAQHRSTIIQMTRVPLNYPQWDKTIDSTYEGWVAAAKLDFNKRWPTASYYAAKPNRSKNNGLGSASQLLMTGTKFMPLGQWYVAKLGSVWIAARPMAAKASLSQNEKNEKAHYLVHVLTNTAAVGAASGFVVEVIETSKAKNIKALERLLAKASFKLTGTTLAYTTIQGEKLEFSFTDYGNLTDPLVDWGYGPTTQQLFQTSPPFLQPTWPTYFGSGRIPSFKINGRTEDLSQTDGIYNGPNVLFLDKVLSVTSMGRLYKVDYTKEIPQFSSK